MGHCRLGCSVDLHQNILDGKHCKRKTKKKTVESIYAAIAVALCMCLEFAAADWNLRHAGPQ